MVVHIRKSIIIVSLIVLVIAGGICTHFGIHWFYRQSYPTSYASIVQKYAQMYEIDPLFIYAVIKTESDFDHDAVSEADARGLTQVAETTFDWIKGKLGEEDTVFSDLFDPEVSIRYGSYFLHYLYEEFGSYEMAAAAYHAGRGAVSEWVEDPSLSHDGESLHTIPSTATAHYVNKVMQAYERYTSLYPDGISSADQK